MHHAVPVSICPGSPGRYYSRHVPAPRTTRLNHLPIHAPYYNHHPESEGKDLIILNLRKSSSSCSLCRVERLRVFPKPVYIYTGRLYSLICFAQAVFHFKAVGISGNRLRSADYSRFSSFDIYSSIHPSNLPKSAFSAFSSKCYYNKIFTFYHNEFSYSEFLEKSQFFPKQFT